MILNIDSTRAVLYGQLQSRGKHLCMLSWEECKMSSHQTWWMISSAAFLRNSEKQVLLKDDLAHSELSEVR